MDGEYRKRWDEGSIVDYDICKLDGYNDIGYYASELESMHGLLPTCGKGCGSDSHV